MSKQCIGCGAILQYEQKDKIGYTPKKEADLCQRCFRIRHYNDVVISMKEGIDSNEVLKQIAQKDALILWIADLFDFEANLVSGINRHLAGKDIVLVATKRDLLPHTLSNHKIATFLQERLKEAGIFVKGIVVVGNLNQVKNSHETSSIEELQQVLQYYRNGRDVVVMGMANAGKSTLLNALLQEQNLTTSCYPGTTLELVAIPMEEGYTIYDSPGLTRYDSILTKVDDALLQTIIPKRALKARNYQLYEDQSLAVGGLVRFDIFGGKKVSCVGYFADTLNIHRGKQRDADVLWQRHMGGLLSPALEKDLSMMQKFSCKKTTGKIDVVIHGLGWFCVSGDFEHLCVYVPQGISVTFRKAMI